MSEEPATSALEVTPPRKRTPGPLADRCGMCRSPLQVHDLAWQGCSSIEGLVITANYCDERCEDEALLWPEDVADEMRSRSGWRGLRG